MGRLFDRWLRDVKFGQMLSWAGGCAVAAHEFCGRAGVPEEDGRVASGAVAVVAMTLYLLNPKGREWVPPGAKIVDLQAEPEEPRFAVELPTAPPPADIPAWKTAADLGSLSAEEAAMIRALRASRTKSDPSKDGR